MKELRIVDKDTGDILEEVEFSGGYNFTYANNHDSGHMRHIKRLNNGKFDTNHWIKNDIYRPVANKLVEKFKEISHVRPERIIFIEDTYWEQRSPQKRTWIARIKKTNKEFAAMTGYLYIIETRQFFLEKMSKEQVVATIYHELRHIDADGNTKEHDIEDWDNMIATLGADWNNTMNQIPDIMEDDFEEWDKLRKAGTQVNMFENVRVLRTGSL